MLTSVSGSSQIEQKSLLTSLLGDDIEQMLCESLSTIANSKQFLQLCQQKLDELFVQGQSIDLLIQGRSALIDIFIYQLWQTQGWDDSQPICIAAVGGYGRGELHPHSDVDLLILHRKKLNDNNRSVLEKFVTALWDCGLEIGHSVRTPAECLQIAKEDITVLTNLIESRPLLGDAALYAAVIQKATPQHIWSVRDFFVAKCDEQRDRHRRHDSTEHNLEPNIKLSPGGLRDIQTICWITLRTFGESDLSALGRLGLLTEAEAAGFMEGIDFLWRARYALHVVASRHEDRLLFEHQVKVAELLGFSDDNANLAVEKFMREYYRRALLLAELNDVLIQYFNQEVLGTDEGVEVVELNDNFCVRDGYIDVTDDQVFANDLSALMEIFLLMAENTYIRGVRASTIRLMRTWREKIDDEFRDNLDVKMLFMRLLRSGKNVPLQLKRMRQYGILSKYLPAFSNIIGQMQYDLFHVYTVDIHTLEVIDNVYKFVHSGSEQDYLLAARVLNGQIKIELLYLAALFHDIAKGRGGNHSELGADDARDFCRRHGLLEYETNLVVWLVEKHLVMSTYSQKQDLSDPEVIRQFAIDMADRARLDYLFILTVADINGTNPELWTSWRASLLRQLHAATNRALRRGLEQQVDKSEIIKNKLNNALAMLEGESVDTEAVEAFWADRVDEYFLRESVVELAVHAKHVVEHGDSPLPLIIVRLSEEFGEAGITQITIYNQLVENRFTRLTSALEELNLSIYDARLQIAGEGYVIDTFYVLNIDGGAIDHSSNRIAEIHDKLHQVLVEPEEVVLASDSRVSRRMRSFDWPSQTIFSNDYAPGFSVLEVIAPDRPGFLAVVGQVFFDHKLRLHSAKISTLGERVEDVFFLTDRSDQIIENPELIERIQQDLRDALDENTRQSQPS